MGYLCRFRRSVLVILVTELLTTKEGA
jgi:hypothetical protein